jgi:glycerol-3-phosphate responsive antiterminator
MKKPEITKENKFSMIAMESLIKILNDQTLMDHHITVLKGIDHLVNEIGKDCIEFLPLIIPSILNWIGLDEGIEMSPLQITKFYDSLKNIIKNAPQCIN